jgi:hypothetical protein
MRPRGWAVALAFCLTASLAVSGQSAAVAQKPELPATGLIAGRIVDATTGRPVAGALVVTFAERGATAALTNAAGQFVLDRLPAGNYPLFASKFGYVPGRYVEAAAGAADAALTLDAAGRVTDVVIRLWKRGAITGRVVDERGDPIVDVEVAALRLGGAAGAGDEMPHGLHASTDDRGIYRLGALAPGDYVVFVASTQTAVPRAVVELSQSTAPPQERAAIRRALFAAGGSTRLPGASGSIADGELVRGTELTPSPSRGAGMVYRTTFFPAAASSVEATVIPVAAGEERAGVDIAMHPVPAVRVSGRLAGSDGPVAFQPIRLVHESAGEFAVSPDPPAATSVTNRDGAFTFLGVPAGRYRLLSMSMPEEDAGGGFTEVAVSVTAAGVSTEVMVVEAMAPPRAVGSAKPVHWARESIVVGEKSVDGVDASFRQGFRFRGRVVFEGPGKPPEPTDPRWLPLSIERADGRPIGFDRWVDQSPEALEVNARGEFATGYVPPGAYLLRVPKPLPGWRLKSAVVAGRDLTDEPLDVDADVGDVVLTFAATTRLAGYVTGSLAGAGVLVFPADPTRWTNIGASPHRIRMAAVDRDGQFTFEGLPTGDYLVVALRDPERVDVRNPRRLQEIAAVADRVVVAEGDSTRDVRLRIREIR